MSDQFKRATELQSKGLGYEMIGREMGLSKGQVRHLLMRGKLGGAAPIIASPTPSNGLSHYDSARHALAIAKSLDEVMEIADKATAIKEYARRAKDRQLQIDATEIVIRSERRLGEMLAAGKKAGQIAEGRPPKNGADEEPFRTKLDEIGVDKKLSARAQKLASISERAIEARIANWRAGAERGQERITVNILKGGPINGARSVMGSRQEPDDSLDHFPTPPWATRALCELVIPHAFGAIDHCLDKRTAWEPACGEGHMLKVLEEYFHYADGSDIHDYGGMGPDSIIDFVNGHDLDRIRYDWIITNPPFKDGLTERFTLRALELAGVGVAMFVRSQWAVEGVDRYERIFRDRPPTLCAFFVERVNLCKGRWDPDGSTATAYCWLVWIKNREPMAPFWIPPGCREKLTKPDDRERFAAWSLPSNGDGRGESPGNLSPETESSTINPETGEILEAAQ